ncbi:methyltransferase domain-containing protein [Sulfurimonas autotrophica]|uniref:Methyltransferase type 12 n=1 Tax=Sulfurimonas autotrophica (strain ATCC BAA-671 / DSM 16294 / JCM 11897 / OK10) TaxID=563040 RepID=E0US83_SULAO|nr:methyltransferase domain-containing protein [Sulfurimonas autotrophica]ADN10176.1 Methyltransferase type 12 [Sulfurimonas autotrophica DSM 16294]
MKVSSEFSKYAMHYGSYNVIQQKVADKLLSFVASKPKNILDLGCGNGAMAKKISWKYNKLMAVDFAPGMLELHPKSENIECIYGNFNDANLFELLKEYNFDYILSASALQWADDMEKIFEQLQTLHIPVALAVFTANTFETLYKTAGLEPLLINTDKLNALQKKYFNANFEVVHYKLEFDNVRDMFRYIKKSGVSASRNVLSYKEMKKLMQEYPLNYLEFEVAFIY